MASTGTGRLPPGTLQLVCKSFRAPQRKGWPNTRDKFFSTGFRGKTRLTIWSAMALPKCGVPT
jgi:hypothetical protein